MTGAVHQPLLRPTTLRLQLVARRALTDAITEFSFAPDSPDDPGGQLAVLPGFSPGAHITVETPSGAMRRYSLIGDPADRQHYVIAVKHEPKGRGGSASLHDQAMVGDTFKIEPPQNEFELLAAPAYLFIAGGIGITPILSMVRSLDRAGNDNYRLIYCTREPQQTAFLSELQAANSLGEITIHHDQGDPEQVFDFWSLLEEPDKTHIYCCGPAPLMAEVGDMTGHWPMHAVHFETFSPVQPVRVDDRTFAVQMDNDPPVMVAADQTILEALRANGLTVQSSCESGSCGTCKTRLLSGEVDHRDFCLSDEERKDHLMICVSRASNGDLVMAS